MTTAVLRVMSVSLRSISLRLAAALALAVLLWVTHAAWLNGPAPVYVVAANLVRSGEFDARVYDDDGYAARVVEATHGAVSDTFAPNSPTLALLLLPLSAVSDSALRVLWAAANFAALCVSVALVLSTLAPNGRIDGRRLTLLGAGAMASAPLYENLKGVSGGQVYLFILLLHAAAFWAVLRGRESLAGIWLGLLLALKVNGWPIWIVLLVLKRWRVLGWAIGATLALGLFTLMIFGADVWRAYLTHTLPAWSTGAFAAVPAYQSLNGFFQHLFRYDSVWNPAPMLDAAWLAGLAPALASAVLLVVSAARSRRLPLSHAMAAGVVLSAILSPLAEQYHFLILVVPFGAALSATAHHAVRWRVLLGLAAALIVVALPYKDSRIHSGALALVAYPRLYGALALWGLLVFAPRPVVMAASELR